MRAEIDSGNGTKLVRVSTPSVIRNADGRERLIEFQYTRFSPLEHLRCLEVFNRNSLRERSKGKLIDEFVGTEIRSQHDPWDAFIDNDCDGNNFSMHYSIHSGVKRELTMGFLELIYQDFVEINIF